MNKTTDSINGLQLQYKKSPISKSKYNKFIQENTFYNPQDTETLDLCIIVVAYNEDDLIFRLFDSIHASSSNSYELIVVDNGLSEVTREKLKTFSLRHIVLNENVGCSTGRNIGSIYCSSSIIFFVDADGYLESMDLAIEKAKYLIQNKDLVAIRGKILEIQKRIFSTGPKNYDLGNDQLVSFLDAEGVTLIKKKDFIKVGGFEDGMVGHEGIVLSYRMIEYYGYDTASIIYDPNIVLFHNYPNTIYSNLEKKLRYMIHWEKVKLNYPLILYYLSDTLILRPKIVKSSLLKGIINNLSEYYVNLKFSRSIHEEFENHKILNSSVEITFSVIITCYNMGEIINRAVESVRTQTLNGIQIILVDDCSTDPKSLSVLEKISPDVELVKLEKNSGVSVARNRGIRESKAQYICCLDGDDYLEPSYLEKAKNIFDSSPEVGIVSAYQQSFGGNNWKFKPEENIDIVDALVDNPLPAASCFRKEVSADVNMYDENLRSHEDWDHWIKILGYGWKVRVIPEFCINYYVRKNSKFLNNIDNAEQFASIIVNNNKELYKNNIGEIFSKKHAKHTKRREDHRKLKYSIVVRVAEYIVNNLIPGFIKLNR